MDITIRTELIEFFRSWAKERSGKTIFWRTASVAVDRIEKIMLGGQTHRHKKHGTEYALIGYGKMQAECWGDRAASNPMLWSDLNWPCVDMREVAIYRSVDDGSLWVRPREEFEDGRFEETVR